MNVPTGLPDDHVLFAVDYDVHEAALDGVYDPRTMELTADGTLVIERVLESTLSASVAKLDATQLREAWSSISESGVAADGVLRLPGFETRTVGRATDIFRVNDGTLSTTLTIDDLGSETIFPGDPPIPASEMSLRAAATRLTDELRPLAGAEPWTPPALLLWWRGELPADWDATVVPWSVDPDLATGGHAISHPVWQRCVRLDAADAAAMAAFASCLPIEHLVERDGARYAIDVRPIHAYELADVACP